jgi:hypothetical protein
MLASIRLLENMALRWDLSTMLLRYSCCLSATYLSTFPSPSTAPTYPLSVINHNNLRLPSTLEDKRDKGRRVEDEPTIFRTFGFACSP